MYKRSLIILAAAVSVAACNHNKSSGGTAPGAVAVMPDNAAFLPPGMVITAKLDDDLSTANKEGEGVNLTVAENIMAKDGSVAIPAGTPLQGRLTGVHNAQAAGEPNVVRINFDDLALNGQHYPFTGKIVSIQPLDPPAGSPIGNIVSDKDANKMASSASFGPGAGQIVMMNHATPGGDGLLHKGSTFNVQLTQGISVK